MAIRYRGFILHVSHYDPSWMAAKNREKPFDARLAKVVVSEAAKQGFNLLVVDVADGVRYKSHPELKRRYSVPMDDRAA